ncbi:energy-coupling factor ABC transporter ATP-binding protein [Marimonas sp. MJW-29]|uniref:Energy-coupling factor ABC transporter ATP-binding protein n=1 Tax=Sulfitobacter sediminis TaxID=3234186 RepID=A0ABV3RH70_9RHOB
MSQPPAPLIDLQNVTYAPEGKAVLSGITLRADERRIGVVGRNGSGKTTLARIMAGLIAPDSGKVRIDGTDVAKDRKAALRRVGILFQNPDHQIIFPTVEEEIAFGLTQMGQPAEEAAEGVARVLARFEKEHWARAAIHQLSQGQRQLVCLMSVLAMAPTLIILDEPFAGLDIPTTRQLERVLAGLDVTLVLITHAPEAVQGYDRVLWIDEGKILRDGAAQPVLAAFTQRMAQIGDGDDLSHLAG